MSIHSELIGDNVHQPKGANTATRGQTLKADGLGGTSWASLFIQRVLKLLGFTSTTITQTQVTPTAYTKTLITDNTTGTVGTTIETVSSEATTADIATAMNNSFATILGSLNAVNTGVESATYISTQNALLITLKLNEIIQLLQDLTITKES